MTSKKEQTEPHVAVYMASHIEDQSKEEEDYEAEDTDNKQLQEKFEDMTKEIIEMPKNPDLFKNHQLPLARIKKIMKSDEDVRVRQ